MGSDAISRQCEDRLNLRILAGVELLVGVGTTLPTILGLVSDSQLSIGEEGEMENKVKLYYSRVPL